MRKRNLLLAASIIAVTMSSCSTTFRSASQRDVTAPVAAAAIADFEVSNQKITYTLVPTRKVRAGGFQNCVNTAISEALKANGEGDVLIETQQAIVKRSGLFGTKIKSVTVTGYPAKYKNFRNADEQTVKTALTNGTLKMTSNENSKSTPKGIFGFFK